VELYLKSPYSLLLNRYRSYFRVVHWPGHEADDSPSSAKVKNKRAYTSTPPHAYCACLHTARCQSRLGLPHAINCVLLNTSKCCYSPDRDVLFPLFVSFVMALLCKSDPYPLQGPSLITNLFIPWSITNNDAVNDRKRINGIFHNNNTNNKS